VHRASSPKEEDSIKDLVRRTFEQLWFDDRHDAGDARASAGSETAALVAASTPRTPRGPRKARRRAGGSGGGGGDDDDDDDDDNEKDDHIIEEVYNKPSPRVASPPTRRVQVKFDGGWWEASALAEVPTGTKVRFSDGSSSIVPADEVAERIREVYSKDAAALAVAETPPGWRSERSAAGLVFVAPSGQRCLSAAEAHEVARRTSASLAPVRAGGGANAGSRTTAQQHSRVVSSAAQMVEVVAGVANSAWLVGLLKGMLFGAGEGTKAKKEDAKRRKAVASRCEGLVACCIEFLLALDETDDGAGRVPFALEAPASPHKEDPAGRRARALVATLSTLHVFCRASPALLAPHVETLLPYLKGENQCGPAGEAIICSQVANVTAWALLLLPEGQRDPETLKRAGEDLKKLTYKHNAEVIHAAVECMATLESAGAATTALMDLAAMFYKVLRARVALRDFSGQNLAYVNRGLVVLGAVCRYRRLTAASVAGSANDGLDLDEDDDDQDGRAAAISCVLDLPAEVSEANLRGASYCLFLEYLKKDQEAVATKALQGLGAQLIGSPRLMLAANRDGVVGAALGHASPLLRLEAVTGWKEILEAEETRVESGLARKELEDRLQVFGGDASDGEDGDAGGGGGGRGVHFGDGVSAVKAKVQGDQDSSSSVVGGVLQMHVGAVLKLLFDTSRLGAAIRKGACGLLGVMLRQGMVNRSRCSPTWWRCSGTPRWSSGPRPCGSCSSRTRNTPSSSRRACSRAWRSPRASNARSLAHPSRSCTTHPRGRRGPQAVARHRLFSPGCTRSASARTASSARVSFVVSSGSSRRSARGRCASGSPAALAANPRRARSSSTLSPSPRGASGPSPRPCPPPRRRPRPRRRRCRWRRRSRARRTGGTWTSASSLLLRARWRRSRTTCRRSRSSW